MNYAYDNLYRLTAETISADPGGQNGLVSYAYDKVGNRLQQTSTVPAITSGGYGYDADDRLTIGDTYDANGNTTSSGGVANVYDFENHLVQQGSGVTVVYDGDGNRVSKTVAGVTTTYLVSDLNPTGYVQVLGETITGPGTSDTRSFTYGLDRISQWRYAGAATNYAYVTSYYVYDGHGSVRALADPSGNVTDTYDYDAFGNLIHSTTTLPSPTPNEFLFAGEQYDSDLHLYYNRARYLNTSTGRFLTMDTFEGDAESPLSLHKYLYVTNDPVNQIDRTGQFGLDDVAAVCTSIMALASNVYLQATTVLTTIYLTMGPAVPLLVEKGTFWLLAGASALALVNDAASGLSKLANNLNAYNGPDFPVGPGPAGIAIGRASGQNLGDRFPAFDNWEHDTGEATQLFSTRQVSTPQQLLGAISGKVSDWKRVYDSMDTFSGKAADGVSRVEFTKAQIQTKNCLVVTPRLGYSLGQVATGLEQLEESSGLDQIVVLENDALGPLP